MIESVHAVHIVGTVRIENQLLSMTYWLNPYYRSDLSHHHASVLNEYRFLSLTPLRMMIR